ncbi:serine/threonine-protein phosphatase 4 regulatory subunit 2 [Copidosoma floridanum]|uniref:serine/threonine-protein phosphatase 4 regulatory subunit 2 n=1 Tax=Copidosoma floridanum TaxID=29053 RepID=UPI0006C9DE27|nr:serine/threonine-protein phosphatase 4 regulatory subunit 2 [Copidosoma floridanum]
MMDNPEDVLQALDEFQKMKPSEIPKVLEEYLTWVAKTGEPVYQWSLIKTLFREKLLRVMNEFCESGNPSLLGPPLPNVEPFNYENMKGSLLERLESFSNPPFTVQRICELLIAPRREYNRIDKYMRAVEKNILVVSTREPGAFGRRSENGDSLVNGSVEDETSHHGQSSNDVDMENWVKDCTSATPTAMHTAPNEDMAVDSSELKSFEKQERIEQLSVIDATASSYVTSAVDFQVATTIPPPIPTPEVSAVVQNLAVISGEAPGLVDVDAIMNEDTSSQPSLELESDENDSNDSKKLPTTFQTKDFKLDENKSSDSESQDSKSEDSVESVECSKETELIQPTYTEQKPVDQQESSHEVEDASKINALSAVAGEPEQVTMKIEPPICEKSEVDSNVCADGFQLVNNVEVKQNDTEEKVEVTPVLKEESMHSIKVLTEEKVEIKAESVIQENIQVLTGPLEEPSDKTSNETNIAIIEEPPSKQIDSNSSIEHQSTELTIQEVVEDEVEAKTIVPDSIPFNEEPKETKVEEPSDDAVSAITEELVTVPDTEPQSVITNINNCLVESQVAAVPKEDSQVVTASCEQTVSIKETVESMDVDDGSVASVQPEEPMEQDVTEAMNS